MAKVLQSVSVLIITTITVFTFNATSGHPAQIPQLSRIFTKLISSISVKGYLNGSKPENIEKWLDGGRIRKIEEKVKFQLFNDLVPEGVFIRTPEGVNTSNLIPNAPVKFVTHGWLAGGNGVMCQQTKEQYLKSGRNNVFVIHWDQISMSYLYLFILKKLKFVSAYCADFIGSLIKNEVLESKNIHFVGHSLGAHVFGQVGRLLKAENISIPRITGLDPAYPGFHDRFGFEKLTEFDAEFVDVVHTCGRTLGIIQPIGHVDFYPNGGAHPMPGCFWLNKPCSHSRSWRYFAESIINPFETIRCESYSSFRNGKCSDEYIKLGENVSMETRGRYFFRTNSVSPYNLEKNGTSPNSPNINDESLPR